MVWGRKSWRRTQPAPLTPRSDEESPRDFGGSNEAEFQARQKARDEARENPEWRRKNEILAQFDGDDSSDDDEAIRRNLRQADAPDRLEQSDGGASPRGSRGEIPTLVRSASSSDAPLPTLGDGGGRADDDVLAEAARLVEGEEPPARSPPKQANLDHVPASFYPPAIEPLGVASPEKPRPRDEPREPPPPREPDTQRSTVAEDLCIVDMTETADDLEAALFGSPGPSPRDDGGAGKPLPAEPYCEAKEELHDPLSFGWHGSARTKAPSPTAARPPPTPDDPLMSSSRSFDSQADSQADSEGEPRRKSNYGRIFGGSNPGDKPKEKRGSFFSFGRKKRDAAAGETPPKEDGGDGGSPTGSPGPRPNGANPRAAPGNVIVVAPRHRGAQEFSTQTSRAATPEQF